MSGAASASSAAAASAASTGTRPTITATHQRIQDLVAAVAGPDERLDPEVEALILDLADDFVEDVANFACRLAKHRHSNTLDVQDLQMHLMKNWQISIPGFSVPEPLLSAPSVGPSSGPSSTLGSSTGLHVRNILTPSYGIGEAHRKRMALVAKVKTKEAKKVAASMQAVAAATNTGAVAEEANGAANGSTAPKPNAAAAAQQKKRKRPNEE